MSEERELLDDLGTYTDMKEILTSSTLHTEIHITLPPNQALYRIACFHKKVNDLLEEELLVGMVQVAQGD